jgi:geranylgeranyl diphosphate synthase type II
MDIAALLSETSRMIDVHLAKNLETPEPLLETLYSAMRYSALSGGKRIRPFLTLETAQMFGCEAKRAIYFAVALEMVHTYSLIHDDLPCMDDDDMRRGKPTNHKVYGEATATLAGDALLTGAFELLCAADLPSDAVRAAVRVLAEAAGADGMVGGQVMDLAAENNEISFETLVKLHTLKTGAMITAAVRLGMIAAGVTDEATQSAMIGYARHIGLAFQIVDDVLDASGDESTLGKPIGSDAEQGKVTFLHFLSPEEAMAYAEKLTESAEQLLMPFENADTLRALARYLLERNH